MNYLEIPLPIKLILAAAIVAFVSAIAEAVGRVRKARAVRDWLDDGYEDYVARDVMPVEQEPEHEQFERCPDCYGSGIYNREAMRMDGISYPAITGAWCQTCDGSGVVSR